MCLTHLTGDVWLMKTGSRCKIASTKGNITMNTTHLPQQASANHHAADHDAQGGDILAFDDVELELALKSVSWNARDLEQFLRSHRAQ